MYLILMSSMQYKFTRSGGMEPMVGRWWNMQLIGEYVPQVSLEMLAGVYQQYGWRRMGDEEILIKYK